MADFKLTGGCHCGAVRYTITAPAKETHHCHCSICRKVHGTLFVTLSVFPHDKFTFDKGADNLATYNTSAKLHRHFCKTCGCQLTIDLDDAPDVVAVATGTIDNGAHPGHPQETLRHIFVGSKVPWYNINEDLPQIAGA
ncbi:MAG: GFA family protein [Deltaproteobacteria bacterium]|nr:GFA family protein [Deltaproteobacteria bacterium]